MGWIYSAGDGKVKVLCDTFGGFKEELPRYEFTEPITSPPAGGMHSGFSSKRPKIMTAAQQ